MKSTKMKFKNPSFDYFKGEFNTFRLGEKWRHLSIGEEVEFINMQGEGFDKYIVTGVLVQEFQDISLDVFKKNHDPALRRPLYMYRELREIYDEDLLDKVVTVVMFKEVEDEL